MQNESLSDKIIIEEHTVQLDAGQRINAYDYLPGKLVTIPSRKGVKKAFKRQQLYKGDTRITERTLLLNNDLVTVYEYIGAVSKVYRRSLNVCFEDDYLAIIEKPSGLLTSGNQWKTLQNALPYNIQRSPQKDALSCPLTVHRLDAKTHGVVVIAKTMRSRIVLGEMFAQGNLKKEYKAFVKGEMKGEGVIETQIDGKRATTHFSVVDHFEHVKDGMNSVVMLRPHTGRKHQLRKQLSGLGHPIIGDVKYTESGQVLKGKGLFLCATSIAFEHPFTGNYIAVQIPLPNKFQRYRNRMENWQKRLS